MRSPFLKPLNTRLLISGSVVWMCLSAIGQFALAERSPATLVVQLGSASFRKRAAAEQELLRIGAGSLSAVAGATHSDDPEIRLRAQRLLELVQQMAIVENKDLILNKPWTLPPEYTPGWELFHSYTGDSLASRELYLQMLQQEPRLMLSMDLPGGTIHSAFERRCADLRMFIYQRSGQHANPATVAALLFVSIHPDCQPSSNASAIIDNLLNDSQFDSTLENSNALQSLLSAWIISDQAASAQTRLNHAAKNNLAAGLVPAYEILNTPFERSKILTQNAILFLAKYGGHAEMDRLEQLLDTDTLLYPSSHRSYSSSNRIEIQVRDVALLGLLHLTGQDADSYGFAARRDDRRYLYAPNHGGFKNDDERKTALELWKKWRSDHPQIPIKMLQDASLGPLCMSHAR